MDTFSMEKHVKAAVADVPRMNFFMVDGQGDPNTVQSFKHEASERCSDG